VRRARERAEFVVVQEAFATAETCAIADLLLPATTWGEKEGTVTNSERCITRVRAAVPPPGQARHDWQIVVDLAQRLKDAPGIASDKSHLHMAYTTPEEIWLEHRESTRGRDLDITGMRYDLLQETPLQWPMPEGASQGKARLYEDGVYPTASGRAKFAAIAYVPTSEVRESRFPFSLNTGRLRDQWHGMTRTGVIGKLFGHVPEPVVQLNSQDMVRLGFAHGDLVHVTSKRGSIVLPAQASEELGANQAFIAMHWGASFLSGRDHQNKPLAGVNAITTSAYCPTSKQPELKHAAVKVLRAELPWTLLALAWLNTEDSPLRVIQSLREQMVHFEFASCVPFSSDDGAKQGVLFRGAWSESPDMALVHTIEELLGLSGTSSLRYVDAKRCHVRSMRVRDALLEGFVIAGDTSAEKWLNALLQTQASTASYGRRLLMTGVKPPVALVDLGATVCTCVGVRDIAIATHLNNCKGDEETRLTSLKSNLGCGTQCGSCIPQLKRMIATTPSSGEVGGLMWGHQERSEEPH
jgi:assimilatory nitrate reductase catalytic subunit